MDNYAVIDFEKIEILVEEKCTAQAENYYLKQRVRNLEDVLLKAYLEDDTYSVMIDRKVVATLLNLEEAKNDK